MVELNGMGKWLSAGLVLGFFSVALCGAQATAVSMKVPGPSVQAPASSSMGEGDKGRRLLDQMVEALGGQAWLGLKDYEEDGRIAAFSKGAPTGSNVQFFEFYRLPIGERIEFATPRNIMPGSTRDVVQVWTADNGYEVTYKGKKPLETKLVEEYLRVRAHTIREVVTEWMKRPGVVVVSEGTSMVERRLADKFTVLSPDNDAVTIETDQNTHLPLRRSFEYRNAIFKDHDQDALEFEDYHTYQGLPTALSVTRYKDGDMVSQRFVTKVIYNPGIAPEKFDPDKLPAKK